MSNQEFATLALSFPGTEEHPHFDRRAFKITGSRIFATLLEQNATANLKLPPEDQIVFCAYDRKLIYAVPNKWGLQGWTTFELSKIPPELMLDALNSAYKAATKKKH